MGHVTWPQPRWVGTWDKINIHSAISSSSTSSPNDPPSPSSPASPTATSSFASKHKQNVLNRLIVRLGQNLLYCPNDPVLLLSGSKDSMKGGGIANSTSSSTTSARVPVPMTASYSSTIAEELVRVLRKLHSVPSWQPLVNNGVIKHLRELAADVTNLHAPAAAASRALRTSLVVGNAAAARSTPAAADVTSMTSSSESPLLSSMTASDMKLPSKDYR